LPNPTGGRIPYRYEIDSDRQLVIATFFGAASLADAEGIVAQLRADPRHSPMLPRLYDCRAVTRMPPVSELRAVAELFRRSVDPTVPVRRAIVVKTGAYFGLGRMLQALLDLAGVDLNVFSDFDDAVEWVTNATA